MPAITYVMLFCGACGERRKIHEPRKHGELEWAEFRHDLECPLCKGQMKRMEEYGAPVFPAQGFWPMSDDIACMA